MTAPDSLRRPNRSPVVMQAVLTRACGNSEGVTVQDLSMDGCKVQSWLSVGDRVNLSLPRIGKFDAVVRWARSGRAGLQFERGAAAK